MKKSFPFVVTFFLHMVFISETLADDLPPAFQGRMLYVSYCLICHGVQGKGDGPLTKSMKITPADLTIKILNKNDNAIRKSITGERRHADISKSMPRWKDIFNKSEVSALISYLRFLSIQQHPLMGNPEVGRKLYNRHCHMCHGTEGDGNGLMKDLINIKPVNHTNAQKINKLSNDEIIRAILDGKGKYMPAWEGILTQTDAEGLVSYIRLLSQTWERMKKGGMVILIQSIDTEKGINDVTKKSSELACPEKSVISKSGIQQAEKLRELFKSRDIHFNEVMTTSSCLAKETARLIFGDNKRLHIKTLKDVSDSESDDLIKKLEHMIAFWNGRGNLAIVTHEKNIRSVALKRFKKREFLVLRPMQDSGFDVIEKLKY